MRRGFLECHLCRARHASWQVLALTLLSIAGCDGPTSPATANAIVLSADNINLVPGDSITLDVTVSPHRTAIQLVIWTLPPGLEVTFEPAMLAAGDTHSELTVRAALDARDGIKAFTIRGEYAGPVEKGLPPLMKLLTVHVQPCPGFETPTNCWGIISGAVQERLQSGATTPFRGLVVAGLAAGDRAVNAGTTVTNERGEYRFNGTARGAIALQLFNADYDQPCASAFSFDGHDVTRNLEVVSRERPIFVENPELPAVVGVVYETTAAGRQPVSGAHVYFEVPLDIFDDGVTLATTTTDERGRYSLCRLPFVTSVIVVQKDGYTTSYTPVDPLGRTERDVELNFNEK